MRSLEYQTYKNNHPNPLMKYAAKCYSQSDEDGITLELVRRINPAAKEYLELGVGVGMENNTLILAANGWKGQWIGNEIIAVAHQNYTNAFITKDNIVSLINVNPSVISIDLDGNDYHILKAILEHKTPDIIIVEYNAKFIPPIKWVMPYDEQHAWNGGDYFGASLQSFVDLLLPKYFLVACNPATGANAFFINSIYWEKFPELFCRIDYTNKEYAVFSKFTHNELWVPPFYQTDLRQGHIPNIKTINTFI